MKRQAIPSDATLPDILSSLNSAEEQVRKIFSVMHECKMKHGNALIRIGVTGEGKEPYYKVLYEQAGSEMLFGTFYGERRDNSFKPGDGAWSSNVSSYEDVQKLLGLIRGK